MIAPLLEVLNWSQTQLQITFLIFLRVGAAMAFLPGFGEQIIPVRVRLGCALAFTLILQPALTQYADAFQAGKLLVICGIEILVGLVFGFLLRLYVHALQIAGSIAAQSVSLSQLLGPTQADPVPALGQILVLGGLAFAMAMGLHLYVLQYFLLSYELFPPGAVLTAGFSSEWAVVRVAKAFSLGFTLAAPFLIAGLIYNLALGVINRAMPQLMVAFVGAPAITAAGLVLLLLSAPFMLEVWFRLLAEFLSNPGYR